MNNRSKRSILTIFASFISCSLSFLSPALAADSWSEAALDESTAFMMRPLAKPERLGLPAFTKDSTMVYILLHFGRLFAEAGKVDPAAAFYKRAIVIEQRRSESDPLGSPVDALMSELCAAYSKAGRSKDLSDTLEKARLYRQKHIEAAKSRLSFLVLEFEPGLAWKPPISNKEASARIEVASMVQSAERSKDKQKIYLQALDAYSKFPPQWDRADLARVHLKLANDFREHNNFGEARREYAKISMQTADPWAARQAYVALAEMDMLEGNFDGAERNLKHLPASFDVGRVRLRVLYLCETFASTEDVSRHLEILFARPQMKAEIEQSGARRPYAGWLMSRGRTGEARRIEPDIDFPASAIGKLWLKHDRAANLALMAGNYDESAKNHLYALGEALEAGSEGKERMFPVSRLGIKWLLSSSHSAKQKQQAILVRNLNDAEEKVYPKPRPRKPGEESNSTIGPN